MVAMLLAGVKFGYMPYLEWKTAQQQSVNVLAERLNKTQAAISNQALYEQQINTIKNNLKSVEQQFGAPLLPEQAELDIQQWLNQFLDENQVKVIRTGWKQEFSELAGGVYRGVYRFTFSASTYDTFIMLMNIQLQNKYKFVIDQYNLTVRNDQKSVTEMGDVRGSMEVIFWIKTP